MINVLWIDDLGSHTDNEDYFEDVAEDYGIKIVNVPTVDDGMRLIDDNSMIFDAMILDINCYLHDKDREVPQSTALNYAIQEICKRKIYRKIPYFIYSAMDAEGIKVVNIVVPEINPWDNRKLYHKPKDSRDLFEAIKTAVAKQENYQLREHYRRAFGIISDVELLNVIKNSKNSDFDTDHEFLWKCRKCMEQVVYFLNKNGLIDLEYASEVVDMPGSSNHVKVCSEFFNLEDKAKKFIPTHIKRLFFLFSSCANESSHSHRDCHREPSEFKTPNLIESNKAPYLNQTCFYGLLTILGWVKGIMAKIKNDSEYLTKWQQHFNSLAEEQKKKSANPTPRHRYRNPKQ